MHHTGNIDLVRIVALLAEGVDRNIRTHAVALLAEGVDRNTLLGLYL